MEELKKAELRSIIGQAIGEASMLWSETPKGVFESQLASDLMERTVKEVENTRAKQEISGGEFWEKLREHLDGEYYKVKWDIVMIVDKIKAKAKQILGGN